MRFCTVAFAAALGLASSAPATAQQAAVAVDGDDLTITGCVTQASAHQGLAPDVLVWTSGDVMLAGGTAARPDTSVPIGTSGIANRVFYWIDDDEGLAKHVGQRVQVEGDVEDVEEGEIEFDRDGEMTDIELDLDGEEQKARVPTVWLWPGVPPDDAEFKIVARRIDVNDIRVLGACNVP